jgi:hypothetical protein
MRVASAFALLALLPAALSAAPPSLTIAAPSCAGGSTTITVPIRSDAPIRNGDQPCCAKGCHTGSSRKRYSCAC